MKLPPGSQVLLLATFLGHFPYPSLSAPTTPQAEELTAAGPNNVTTPVVPVIQAANTPYDKSDDDWFHASQRGYKFLGLSIRGFGPPRPPPLPPTRGPIIGGPGRGPGRGPVPPPVRPPSPPSPPRPPPPPPAPHWQPIPENIDPGMGRGTGAEAKPMEDYARLGQNGMAHYETALRNNNPDTAIVPALNDLSNYRPNEAFWDIRQNPAYDLAMSTYHSGDFKELGAFKTSELGFNFDNSGFVRKVIVQREGVAHPKPTINEGAYHTGGEYIIYQNAFKGSNDGIPNKLPLNEMGMQMFIAAAGAKTRNLKAVFLHNVQNKEFWAITRESYNDMKQPFDQVLTFERGTPQFDRFMGSPNLNSKFYSFANHHTAIGNKVPYKIVIVPKQAQSHVGAHLMAALVFKDA